MRLAPHPHRHHPRQGHVRETFKSAGHVAHPRPEQQVRQDGAAAADELTEERPAEPPARHESRTAPKGISLPHRLNEFRSLLRQMTKPRVPLPDPFKPPSHRLALPPKVPIHN